MRDARGSLREELRMIARLSLPMMAAQGGLMAMGVVDTLMVGRVSSLEMAAVSLGNSVAGVILVLGIGLAMGIEPLVAQALGANDALRARRWLWQGLYVSVLASIPLVLMTVGATFTFRAFGISEALAERAGAFLWARVPGIVFNCSYATLRSYFSSIGKARPVLITVLAANVLNAVLDVLLVFGLLGFPKLGAAGAGLSTSLSWMFMTALLALAVRADPIAGDRASGFVRPRAKEMVRVIALGWPIGLQIAAEVGIFTLVSALIGRFGEVPLAGHQIALTMASLSFMCAVGVANAASARVGFHVGAGDTPMARRSGFLSIAIGGAFMGSCGVVFALVGRPIADAFAPTDPSAAAMGAELLTIAAVFSVSDGVQTVAAGALRGAGDTRWPFYANVVAHWLFALPLAYHLGHELELGPSGYWWALSAGLTAVAVILVLRFFVLSRRAIQRVA